MTIQEQITAYINSLPEGKRQDVQDLHEMTVKNFPELKLWFDDGRNSEGKTVTNPTIGYGSFIMTYANGKSKEYFQLGISANSTGISVYVLGLKNKTYLANTCAKEIGKAKVTSYCISFKAVKDIHPAVLLAAMTDGLALSGKE